MRDFAQKRTDKNLIQYEEPAHYEKITVRGIFDHCSNDNWEKCSFLDIHQISTKCTQIVHKTPTKCQSNGYTKKSTFSYSCKHSTGKDKNETLSYQSEGKSREMRSWCNETPFAYILVRGKAS